VDVICHDLHPLPLQKYILTQIEIYCLIAVVGSSCLGLFCSVVHWIEANRRSQPFEIHRALLWLGRLSIMDPTKYNSQMQNIAYGEAFMAAAKDYKAQMVEEQERAKQQAENSNAHVALKDFFDDPELERLHGERMARLKEEKEKRAAMARKGHGSYEEISEATLLEASTTTERVVAHFFHPDFERCKIMDKHMKVLAEKYFDTRFVKVSAEKAPFLVEKLHVRMLPCVVTFQQGIAGERLVGFDALGKRDDFETAVIENKFLEWQVISPQATQTDRLEETAHAIRKGFYSTMKRTESDEDSDF
jgi:hypothetical protein